MFKRLDLVRLGNGNELIITQPPNRNRPVNPYAGIKPKGQGAQYKFGPKHNPVKIGTVEESHPAIQACQARRGVAGRNSVIPEATKNAMVMLLRAIDRDDIHDIHEAATALAPFLRPLL